MAKGLTFSSTTKGTIPPSPTGTGTITTVGVSLFGIGTLFFDELAPGFKIYDPGQDEVREVLAVINNNEAELKTAFTIDISTPIAFRRIDAGQLRSYDVQNLTGTIGILGDDADFLGNSSTMFDNNDYDTVTFDATGTKFKVAYEIQ